MTTRMYVTMAFSFEPKTSPSQCHLMAFKDKHQGSDIYITAQSRRLPCLNHAWAKH